MTGTDQALAEVEALVAAVKARDYGAVAEVVQSAGGWKLSAWCAEVLADVRVQLTETAAKAAALEAQTEKVRALLRESRSGALHAAAVVERNARREERAAADEIRRENAELIKENRRLLERLHGPGEIHPVGMTIGRAYEIAVEAAERNAA
jgi:hypothetical protein